MIPEELINLKAGDLLHMKLTTGCERLRVTGKPYVEERRNTGLVVVARGADDPSVVQMVTRRNCDAVHLAKNHRRSVR